MIKKFKFSLLLWRKKATWLNLLLSYYINLRIPYPFPSPYTTFELAFHFSMHHMHGSTTNTTCDNLKNVTSATSKCAFEIQNKVKYIPYRFFVLIVVCWSNFLRKKQQKIDTIIVLKEIWTAASTYNVWVVIIVGIKRLKIRTQHDNIPHLNPLNPCRHRAVFVHRLLNEGTDFYSNQFGVTFNYRSQFILIELCVSIDQIIIINKKTQIFSLPFK